MKTLLSVVKTLIKINVAMAFASLLVFAIMREQQARTSDHKQETPENQSYHTAMKAKTTAEQKQLETSYQKIVQHEQQIKKLEGELDSYKNRVNELLFDKAEQPSSATPNTPLAKWLDAGNKNSQSPQFQPSLPLLDQIVKSGQPTSSQKLELTAPSRLSSDQTKTEPNLTTSPVVLPPGEKKITRTETPQLQSATSWTQRVANSLKPSINLPNLGTRPQATQPKPSSTNSSSDTPSQSNTNPNGVSSKATMLARQLSRANSSVIYGPVNQVSDQSNAQIGYANDIVVGLIVADEKGQINYGTKTYKKVQTAIRLLRRGEGIDDAARRSELTPSVLQQLIKWGENRPGNLSELSEISQRNSEVK